MCRAGRHTLEWARVHMLARYRRLFVYMLINTNNKNQINFMMQKRKNESLWPPKVNKWGRWVVKCKLCEGVLQGSQQGALSQHDLCSLLWLTSVDVQVASHSLTWRWQCCITGCCSWPWQCCLNKVYLLKYSKNYLKDGHGYDERAEDNLNGSSAEHDVSTRCRCRSTWDVYLDSCLVDPGGERGTACTSLHTVLSLSWWAMTLTTHLTNQWFHRYTRGYFPDCDLHRPAQLMPQCCERNNTWVQSRTHTHTHTAV